MIYYHDPETGHSVWQSCGTQCFSKHLRLSSIMDEGSSSYSLISALAEHLAVLPVRDSCHKMARVQDMAFSSCPQLNEFKREISYVSNLTGLPIAPVDSADVSKRQQRTTLKTWTRCKILCFSPFPTALPRTWVFALMT